MFVYTRAASEATHENERDYAIDIELDLHT